VRLTATEKLIPTSRWVTGNDSAEYRNGTGPRKTTSVNPGNEEAMGWARREILFSIQVFETDLGLESRRQRRESPT
jgi:hypothetical protein